VLRFTGVDFRRGLHEALASSLERALRTSLFLSLASFGRPTAMLADPGLGRRRGWGWSHRGLLPLAGAAD